jgi:hypothetical protein
MPSADESTSANLSGAGYSQTSQLLDFITECNYPPKLFSIFPRVYRVWCLGKVEEYRQALVALPFCVGATELFFSSGLSNRSRGAHALPYYSNENVVLANLLIDDVLRVTTHSWSNTGFQLYEL